MTRMQARRGCGAGAALAVAVFGLAMGGMAQASAEDLRAGKAQLVDHLAHFRFDQLGNPQLRWDAIPPVYAPASRPHRQLVILVEFADRSLDRFAGEPDQGDRLAEWYQAKLFDERYEQRDTLSHYYASQSLGRYHVVGQVLPPVKLTGTRADYGAAHRPDGGDWRNDKAPEVMVSEALELAVAAHPDMDWSAFDRWDPTDFDGDGLRDEGDGYLDHLVLVFAGGGQSSCQLLHKISDTLNPNVGEEALAQLDPDARECAERLWPHRSMLKLNEAQGPRIEGWTNPLGGVRMTDGLWARDYNMQSEYTDAATFIHEFGHSIGLPDVYSRTSSNSTGGWEVMSGTASPSPQNLSAWSRMMLGWLTPEVILPPEYGGKRVQSVYLQTLDDAPSEGTAEPLRGAPAGGLSRAAMVVLPPKVRTLQLTELTKKNGRFALYSGQGNEMERTAEIRVTLPDAPGSSGRAGKNSAELSFDAWWDIEGGWDFAYVEVSEDDGATWTRRLPVDPRAMPAKHGHDGKMTLPGLTGVSGDWDGDGKNESQKRCNPKKKIAYGEDKAGQGADPCMEPSWVRVAFDLSDLFERAVGKVVRVRVRYYTDMAAVNRGLLLDNVSWPAAGISEDFEGRPSAAWRLDGFTARPGHHELLVPHYYLLEYRDPYAQGAYRYDTALGEESFLALGLAGRERVDVYGFRARPGVVAWYYDGAYAWSENDPATNGQGKGYLLALDANPNEIAFDGLQSLYRGTTDAFNTYYDVSPAPAQTLLESALYETICFARNAAYRPKDVDSARMASVCQGGAAGAAGVKVNGKPFLYSYEVVNSLLPGDARESVQKLGELVDYRVRDGQVSYRMRDRSLRHLHTLDAPFALTPFADGIVHYEVAGEGLTRVGAEAFEAVSRFRDETPARWANPKLHFGGVAVPAEGFRFELATPKPEAPEGSKVKVWFAWDR